jgi:hypothetical protein
MRLVPTPMLPVISKAVSDASLSHIVEILPPVDEKTVKQELAGALGTLVFEDLECKFAWTKGTVTGKLLGLLVSGKPGLIIANDQVEASVLARRVQGWYAAQTVDECQLALLNLTENPLPTNGRSILGKYSVEAQAQVIQKLLFERGYDRTNA